MRKPPAVEPSALPDPNTPAISLQHVEFAWTRRSPLLRIDQFQVSQGERVFLYGPSGSGKTSLLNLLAGVSSPQQGEVVLLGQSLQALSKRRRDRFRARHVGVIFQQFNLIPYLSVLDNVLLAAHFAHRREGALDKARRLLAALGLEPGLETRPAHQLSVGQQQRLAVARALVIEPEILLADEPTSALDSDSRDAFMSLLLQVAGENRCAVVFVSHDRSLEPYFSRAVDIRSLLAEETV
jgi:putative ABC transport system ATP-binding protein